MTDWQFREKDNWLSSLEADAREQGIPMPDPSVVQEAQRIAAALRPHDLDAYAMDEGEMALESFGAPGNGFLLICETGGSALCVVTVDNVSRRARYESSAALPDGFLREGLREVRSSTG